MNNALENSVTGKPILVIYHGNCADGFTAAWAAWKVLGDKADYHAGVYQNPPPEVAGKDVYIVDFNYKLDVMKQICSLAKSITMLDHHKSAMEVFSECNKLFGEESELKTFHGRFTEEESGALITWKWFHPTPAPRFVRIVSERDLWKFREPHTREVMAAIFSHEYSFELWDILYASCTEEGELTDGSFQALIDEGKGIERKHHKDIKELVSVCSFKAYIAGHLVTVASLPYTLTSDAGHLMAGEDKTFAACFWFTPEGVVFSLRSREDGMDVSEIAKKFGGGGHKNAAGFRVSMKNFMFALDNGALNERIGFNLDPREPQLP